MVCLLWIDVFMIGTLVRAAALSTSQRTQSDRLRNQQRSTEIMPFPEARDIFFSRRYVKLGNLIP